MARQATQKAWTQVRRYLAQMRLNSDGELETLRPEDWLARGWLYANASRSIAMLFGTAVSGSSLPSISSET